MIQVSTFFLRPTVGLEVKIGFGQSLDEISPWRQCWCLGEVSAMLWCVEMRFGCGLSCVKSVKQCPTSTTPSAIQSLDNMSIDPGHGESGDDDEDGYGQQQDVKLKVSFLMIPNGMQPPCPVATISVGNRRPSAQKNPRALASARFKWPCCWQSSSTEFQSLIPVKSWKQMLIHCGGKESGEVEAVWAQALAGGREGAANAPAELALCKT